MAQSTSPSALDPAQEVRNALAQQSGLPFLALLSASVVESAGRAWSHRWRDRRRETGIAVPHSRTAAGSIRRERGCSKGFFAGQIARFGGLHRAAAPRGQGVAVAGTGWDPRADPPL